MGARWGDVPAGGARGGDRHARGERPARRESITISFEARDYLEAQEPDAKMEAGATTALRSCLGLHAGDSLLLIVQHDHLSTGAALLRAGDALGLRTTAFVINGRQAEQGAFLDRLEALLAETTASCLLGDRRTLPPVFRLRVIEAGRVRRHAHLVGLMPRMMSQSMRADPVHIHALGERLVTELGVGRPVTVESATGTRLTARFAGRDAWRNRSGLLKAPGWTELPGGEVHAAPVSVDGVLVPDGGIWLADGSDAGRTAKVRLHFAGGALRRVEAPDGCDMRRHLLPDGSSAPRVARVSMGTNVDILAATGSALQDRKMPGLHLTLASIGQQADVQGLSVLTRRPDVRCAERPVLVRGRYSNALLRGLAT